MVTLILRATNAKEKRRLEIKFKSSTYSALCCHEIITIINSINGGRSSAYLCRLEKKDENVTV